MHKKKVGKVNRKNVDLFETAVKAGIIEGLFKDGKSVVEIATMFNVSDTHVYKVCKEEEVPFDRKPYERKKVEYDLAKKFVKDSSAAKMIAVCAPWVEFSKERYHYSV